MQKRTLGTNGLQVSCIGLGCMGMTFSYPPFPDFRNTVPRFSPENRRTNLPVVAVLAGVAKAKDATPSQVALAWLLAQKPWIVPIPGTKRLRRLEENIGAAGVQLSENDLAEIDTALAKIEVRGARYPEEQERRTGL